MQFSDYSALSENNKRFKIDIRVVLVVRKVKEYHFGTLLAYLKTTREAISRVVSVVLKSKVFKINLRVVLIVLQVK